MSETLFSMPFFHFSQKVYNEIREYVQRLKPDQLSDSEAIIKSLVEEYNLKELVVDWDTLTVLPNPREEESYIRDAFGDRIRSVTPVYTFEVNFTGSPKLFAIQPGTSRVLRIEAKVAGGTLSFDVHGSDKARFEQIKEGIQFNVSNQKGEVGNHNNGVESTARAAIERRLQELKDHDKGLDMFGVPVKEKGE